jgi:predicted transcriptional regulator
MINGYARASRLIVPAVRSTIARELKRRYEMTEEEIAGHLGVAQAAVSKYLKGKYSVRIKEIEASIDLASLEEYISRISAGGSKYVSASICRVCRKENEFGCKFSKTEV